MRGCNTLERVILHETIHEFHQKKLNGVIFKIDFEKAYDNVRWPFLIQTLCMKGFSPKWIKRVESFITGTSVAINVNDDIGYLLPNKERPSSRGPFTSSFVQHCCEHVNNPHYQSSRRWIVKWSDVHLVDGDLSILQYANDTIHFMEHDLEQARNMKLLLYAFEQTSGLKINFHKSQVYCFDKAQEVEAQYNKVFGFKSGDFPMT